MPLIMLAGGPLSGKTFITKHLVEQCKKLYPDREVQVLSHETMNIPRRVFLDMNTEKKFNQKLISCVEQALTARRVLIVDFICLTKSLRYQFYGKANFSGTVSCVVQCTTPYEKTLQRHTSNTALYTPEIFEDLWNRYEEPQDTCRWDYPLHTIDLSASDENSTGTDTGVNYEQFASDVLHSICDNSKKTLSRSNLPTRNESGAVVNLLDKITTGIIEEIIRQQQAQGFIVGALLDKNTMDVNIDASNYFITQQLPQQPADSDNSITSVNPNTPNQQASTEEGTQPKSSGLKLVRKKIGAKKELIPTSTSTTTNPNTDTLYILTLHQPLTPSQLFEFKNAFTKIATMMNLKTDVAISKGFIEYLMPLL